MKKIVFLSVLIVLNTTMRATAQTTLSGVVRTDYLGGSGKTSISQMRFNLFVLTATGTYYFVRIEPNRYNLDSEDWLKLAFVSRGRITIGRIPLLEGYSLPAPQNLYTVSWPRISGGFYGNGLQVTEKLSADSSAILEVSGSPNGTAIQDNLGYSQVSLRLAREDPGKSVSTILRYDDNHNSQILVSGERQDANLGIITRGAFYLRSDNGKKKSGGYVFTEKSFGKRFSLHFQTDFTQHISTINTIGLRFKEEESFAILDYEASPMNNRLLASVVVAF
ncbi:hypothetical protein HYV44_01375 [Candidatus Microgenomates bacterium]|nr:hypothetical protein [Candidatus Microgenomates bacterium]